MDRANDLVLLLGRLLMAALFLPSGISKLLDFLGLRHRSQPRVCRTRRHGPQLLSRSKFSVLSRSSWDFFPAQPRCF
jgi:hypothetical protein